MDDIAVGGGIDGGIQSPPLIDAEIEAMIEELQRPAQRACRAGLVQQSERGTWNGIHQSERMGFSEGGRVAIAIAETTLN